MGRLPILKAKKIISVLNKLGFHSIRKKGSHHFFRHPDGRVTVIPVHSREDISRGLLREILKDIEISPKEFLEVFRK